MNRGYQGALTVGVLLFCFGARAIAELTVDITKGVEGAMPVAIVPFAQEGLGGDNMGSIVSADLTRSGRFKAMSESQMPERPAPPGQVNFPAWQSAGQEHVAIGRVLSGSAGRHEVEFFLFDAIRGSLLTSGKIPFSAAESRHTAHRIADIIYQKLTGERGAFNTRVAYVTVTGTGSSKEFHLQIADTDGHDPQAVVSSEEPIMSPAWSPDAKRIAYVSFENRASAIYIQTLATGDRKKVSEAPGINGAPAWSPDGGKLALTLSKDGSPDVYVLDIASGALRQVTRDPAIDTEPNWSPDGRKLLFTSDRGGKPQLYTIPEAGGEAQRLTLEGAYNAGGVFSPDGKNVAMVHGNGGDYRIALMDLSDGSIRVISEGPLDESPGFAPNGSMILYTRKEGGVDRLEAVSVDGKVRQSLRVQGGQVREPAWSP